MKEIDKDVLDQLKADLSAEDLHSVLLAFQDDMTTLGAAIRTATNARDTACFRRVAHGIAGSAGAVGAVALARAARRAMVSGSADGAAAEEIGQLLQQARVALSRFLADSVAHV